MARKCLFFDRVDFNGKVFIPTRRSLTKKLAKAQAALLVLADMGEYNPAKQGVHTYRRPWIGTSRSTWRKRCTEFSCSSCKSVFNPSIVWPWTRRREIVFWFQALILRQHLFVCRALPAAARSKKSTRNQTCLIIIMNLNKPEEKSFAVLFILQRFTKSITSTSTAWTTTLNKGPSRTEKCSSRFSPELAFRELSRSLSCCHASRSSVFCCLLIAGWAR